MRPGRRLDWPRIFRLQQHFLISPLIYYLHIGTWFVERLIADSLGVYIGRALRCMHGRTYVRRWWCATRPPATFATGKGLFAVVRRPFGNGFCCADGEVP